MIKVLNVSHCVVLSFCNCLCNVPSYHITLLTVTLIIALSASLHQLLIVLNVLLCDMCTGLNHHLCSYMLYICVIHHYMLLQLSFMTTTHYTLLWLKQL